MSDETLPPFNPLSKSDLEKRAEILAEKQGFSRSSPEADAFRHAYTAGMMAKYRLGDALTQGFGYLVEAAGLFRNFLHGIGSIFDGNMKADSWDAAEAETYKDLHNNKKGVDIGNSAKDEEDIIRQVNEQIRNGKIISDPNSAREHYQKEYGNLSNVENDEWSWLKRPGNTSGFDFSSLFVTLSGGRGRGEDNVSTGQILFTSANSLASELLKLRRKKLEDDLIGIFIGGHGQKPQSHVDMPHMVPDGLQSRLLGILSGLIERTVGSAFERHSTRTFETERSQEAAQLRFSRGQTETALAEMVARARRNS